VSVYLDASVLVALLINDPFSQRAEAFLRKTADILVVSDFAQAEFSSAIARHVRTREITRAEAQTAFSACDDWVARTADRAETTTMDVAAAQGFLRRLDLSLRTADALHIAIALRIGAPVATFDVRMAASARMIGLPVADA